MSKKKLSTSTDRARVSFLAILRRTGNVSLACRALKIDRRTAYFRKSEDQEFSDQWDNAIAEAVDHLEGEAFRRAFKGCRKPVYQGGQLVGYVKEYSDTLMSLLLKAHNPKFNEKSIRELTGPGGKPLNVTVVFGDDDG